MEIEIEERRGEERRGEERRGEEGKRNEIIGAVCCIVVFVWNPLSSLSLFLSSLSLSLSSSLRKEKKMEARKGGKRGALFAKIFDNRTATVMVCCGGCGCLLGAW